MRLHHEPFTRVKSGDKCFEFRLNDEKRKQIQAGDTIEFTDRETGESITVTVMERISADSFEHFDAGVLVDDDMARYYSDDDIQKNGVVAIRFTTQ